MTWKNLTLYVSLKHGSVNEMVGPNGLEFLLVSVQNANNKVYIGVWYRPPANSESLDVLYSILESLDVRILSSFVRA